MVHKLEAIRTNSKKRLPALSATGDTIVEVLIATAIVSFVIVGAWATAHRSTSDIQDSQEHSEALAVLQGQVEQLRGAIGTPSYYSLVTQSKPFCIDSATHAPVQFTLISSIPALSADNFGNYPAVCQNVNGRYNLSVMYDNSSDTFSFLARWDALGGGRDQVELFYRAHPPVAVVSPVVPAGACTVVLPVNNIIVNGDFSLGRVGFTSYLPWRGSNVYPDDTGLNGPISVPGNRLAGGYSIFTGGNPVKVTNLNTIDAGPPYKVWGTPLAGFSSYYYSNPVKDTSGNGPIPGVPGSSYAGIIWEETNLPVDPGSNYQFVMWVSNIKLPLNTINPQIELQVVDSSGTPVPGAGYPAVAGTGYDVQHQATPDPAAPSGWQVIKTPLISTGALTSITLRIIDHAGAIRDDDFTMTNLGLYKCT